jgi:alpha-ketoglutarate-dependent taurine dioxygenase
MIKLQTDEEQVLPATVVPAVDGVSIDQFTSWIGEHQKEVQAELRRHGALLFHGFGFRQAGDFEQFSRALCPVLQSYVGGNSPRHRVKGAVYTSTEYSASARISLHNEASYLTQVPRWIMFFCQVPAKVGGRTPLADCRRIYAGLRPDVRERFAAKKICYINNLHSGDGIGRSWQDAFESEDRTAVEEQLERGGYGYEWKSDGSLRTSIVAEAVMSHPETGEKVWINQAEQWHPSSLDPKTRRSLGMLMDEEDFPHYATFGDGSPLPEDDLDHIREVMNAEERVFEWTAGDVVSCDNLLVCHGRQPYEGDRRVLVTMS